MTSEPIVEPDSGVGWLVDSFLGVLSAQLLDEVSARAMSLGVAAGQYLYEPELSIVETGVVRAYVTDSGGRQLTVSYIRSGGAVGLTHLIGRDYPVGFQAVSACRLRRLDKGQLCDLAGREPRLGWSAAAEVTRRADEMLAEITRVTFGSLSQRTAYHLLALTEGSEPGADRVNVRQADVALAVGVLRESAARTIGRLAANGLVTTGPSGVTVVDEEGLRRIAQARV